MGGVSSGVRGWCRFYSGGTVVWVGWGPGGVSSGMMGWCRW